MDRKKLIRYLNEKRRDIGIECRIDILNLIAIEYGSEVIHEGNDGCGILFSELDNKLLQKIKDFIDIDLDKHLLDFSDI